jgi:hypothetical protein
MVLIQNLTKPTVEVIRNTFLITLHFDYAEGEKEEMVDSLHQLTLVE